MWKTTLTEGQSIVLKTKQGRIIELYITEVDLELKDAIIEGRSQHKILEEDAEALGEQTYRIIPGSRLFIKSMIIYISEVSHYKNLRKVGIEVSFPGRFLAFKDGKLINPSPIVECY